jgi:hypothetical protein
MLDQTRPFPNRVCALFQFLAHGELGQSISDDDSSQGFLRYTSLPLGAALLEYKVLQFLAEIENFLRANHKARIHLRHINLFPAVDLQDFPP